MKKNKKGNLGGGKRRVRSLELNLILWLSFLLFALVLIVLFTVLNGLIINNHFRRREEDNLSAAGTVLKSMLNLEYPDEISATMLRIANEYSVSAYLFSTDGNFVYPFDSTEEDEHRETYEFIKEKFSELDPETAKMAQLVFTSDDSASLASIITWQNEDYYLYLFTSFEHINNMQRDTLYLSLITGIFAVALSLVVSGFISMVVSRPVTDLTARAEELAKRNYDVRFNKGYFLSELNRLSNVLDYASTEISKADKMQKELIANVSHDFKTPLTMIKAYASMISEISGNDPVKREKHAKVIIDEADRLAALVGDLLDLSKLQAGIETPERTVFNLSEDLYGVAGRFEGFALQQGYTIKAEIEDDLYTYADKRRAEQVLYNLIGNAINYTGDDKTVVIRLYRKGNAARFEVSDSGKGIPPEQIDTIWERYYRSEQTHKRAANGTGLGLAIVKSVLMRQSIPFGVTSKVGVGSCFWVEFPPPPDPDVREDEKSSK